MNVLHKSVLVSSWSPQEKFFSFRRPVWGIYTYTAHLTRVHFLYISAHLTKISYVNSNSTEYNTKQNQTENMVHHVSF